MFVQANKAQLSNTVSTQVEAARSGMALLDRAHKSLANMQNSYKVTSVRYVMNMSLLDNL